MTTDQTTTMSTSLAIADAMAEVARTINAPRTVEEALSLVVDAARDTVPGIDHASVTVAVKGGYQTWAATGDLPCRADDLQYELDEGPCVDALKAETFMQVDELPDDRRWPRYAPRAADLGIRSQLAFPLYTNTGPLGGLNLYATETEVLDADTRHIAELFAAHAALALGKAREEQSLNTALASRKTIGQAIGITQERFGIDEERAFQFLVRVSQTSNIKLREVAAELVHQSNERCDNA